jgi:hypothetical protein
MKKKEDCPRYEPPQAKNLSDFGVRGDGTKGFCSPGSTPVDWSQCSGGADPSQNPALCNPIGALPEWGGCTTGNNAVEGCLPGSVVAQP